MTRDQQRNACFEKMAVARADGLWIAFTKEQRRSFIEDEKRVFDSLHGIARVNPVEATDEMLLAASEFDENSQQVCCAIWRAMSTKGRLTNPPEVKKS
jgi:hypothetical protein